MGSRTRVARLGALIRAKRREDRIGLREAAKESGLSPSTLSRLERGLSASLPDTDTLTSIANWLSMPVSELLQENQSRRNKKEPELKTLEGIELYLRADKDLKPETADALAAMFRMLYERVTELQGEQK